MKQTLTARDEKRDNTTLPEKLRWRRLALAELGTEPVVLECYGGWGQLGRSLYRDIRQGVVLEKQPAKVRVLAQARPSWSVYEGDTVRMLSEGAGRHLVVNYLDIDPYGSPWESLKAFFGSEREHPDRMVVVAHDGIVRLVKMGRAWSVEILSEMVARYGNTFMKDNYSDACWEMLGAIVAPCGFTIRRWSYATGGDRQKAGHWLAVLERQ